MFKHDMAMFKDAIPMLNDAIPMLNDAIPMFKHVIPSERSPMDWNRQWKERGWWRGGACGTRLRAKTFVTSRSEMRSAQSWATPQWSSPWLRPRRGSASVSPGGTRVEKHRARGRKFVATMAVWISQGGGVPRAPFEGAIKWSRDRWFVTQCDRAGRDRATPASVRHADEKEEEEEQVKDS